MAVALSLIDTSYHVEWECRNEVDNEVTANVVGDDHLMISHPGTTFVLGLLVVRKELCDNVKDKKNIHDVVENEYGFVRKVHFALRQVLVVEKGDVDRRHDRCIEQRKSERDV